MKHWVALGLLMLGASFTLRAHDFGTTPITWNREVARIVYDRCASCHREGGTAFSLMTYQDAQPHAVAIKESVLARRMPPWGAVKGFGDFRNDLGLTQEQVELVSEWVEGGMLRGNNPRALPPVPKFEKPASAKVPQNGLVVTGERTLARALRIDGLFPEAVPPGTSPKIVAALPDGSIKPLVWLYEYRDSYRHPFLFRKPMDLPAGTVIRGVPARGRIVLIPVS
jgi:hypothetical protein